MSAKRSTPNLKVNVSKFRTPTNLNNTVAFGSGSRNFRSGSAPKFQGSSNLDVTGIGSKGRDCPHIRTNLSERRMVDYDLECDLAYNEYLQALMKRDIVAKSLLKHEQELNDQLAVQKDKLHKSNTKYNSVRGEVAKFTMLQQINEVLEQLRNNNESFSQLVSERELTRIFGELSAVLSASCCNVAVKNVVPVRDQEGVDEMTEVLEKCSVLFEKILASGHDLERTRDLANSVRKYGEVFGDVKDKQITLNEIQEREAVKLLKHMSDMYARRENY